LAIAHLRYLQIYIRFNGPLSWTTRVSQYQKGKTNLDLLEQETLSSSGISIYSIYKIIQKSHHGTVASYCCYSFNVFNFLLLLFMIMM